MNPAAFFTSRSLVSFVPVPQHGLWSSKDDRAPLAYAKQVIGPEIQQLRVR
jgi:hypothetical protein